MSLDKQDLIQCQTELINLIDSHKEQSGKKMTNTVRQHMREQYELWWEELEEVKSLIKTL